MILKRLLQSYDQAAEFQQWADIYRASRESKELLAESRQLAFSLNAWIKDVIKLPVLIKKQYGFVPVYAELCGRLGLNSADVLTAYTFTVLENQVLAAVKTVPLGQMSGQRILWHIHALVPDVIERALQLKDEQLSSALPSYAMLSMAHETQYSRLFRS
jgi:urease accessory protein